MRALHVGTRLAGTDGVSLEATKLAGVLAERGFERVDLAGEVETPGARCIPEMHFRHPDAVQWGERAFGSTEPDAALEEHLESAADRLAQSIVEVVRDVSPDMLVVQNAWAIPMHLPLAGALARVVEHTGLPTLSHEHDYPWERSRFAATSVPGYLDRYFPWDGPTVRHLAINSPAAHELKRRRGLDATVVPNVMDFDVSMPSDERRRVVRSEVRSALNLRDDQRLILQPTRVIERKGIDLAIDLLARLRDPRNVLVISHESGDEGHDTLRRLQSQARDEGVDLRYAGTHFAPERRAGRFALSDAYHAADFVTFPSRYEGFGNALIETVLHKKAALVNRYAVYTADIAPTGVRFVEIDGSVDDAAVEAVAVLLDAPAAMAKTAEHNFAIGERAFGLPALRAALARPLASLGGGSTT